jgi:hypothetical protein
VDASSLFAPLHIRWRALAGDATITRVRRCLELLPVAFVLLLGTIRAIGGLAEYDTAIADDAVAGLVPAAKLTAAVPFDGATFYPFDFGPISGAASFEFIVEGTTPTADGFLAVGANSASSLRFEQWNNTGQLGFTQAGVADYLFAPGVPTPPQRRHIVYVWDGAGTMQLYVDGALAGSRSGVSTAFAMPTGNGRLGANMSGGEAMTGTIHRVTTYVSVLASSTIQQHADAFLGVVRPPIISRFKAVPAFIGTGQSSELGWQVTGATSVTLDGTSVPVVGSQIVTPAANAVYTLTATSAAGTVSAQAEVKLIHSAEHLVISEFMADNTSTLADDDGDFSDWIEVHNPTANAIALNGWFLTDDPALPWKWALPAGTLSPGGYLLVFASEKNRAPTGRPAHTNFKLDGDGEYLALSGPNGVAHVFSPAFPPQLEDVSFGLIGGDPALAYSLARATPGAANETTSPPPRPVVFSVPSGTFTNSLSVALTTATSTAQIFYTTNGAAPSPITGILYTAPLALNTTTRLRAVAVQNGESSPPSGASYVRLAPDLLAYQSPLPLLVIENFGQGVIPQKGWTGSGAGVRQVPRQDAFWASFERSGGRATFVNLPQMQGRIGIRGRGAYSTTWDQKPFSVESLDEAGAEMNVAPLGLPAHADWVLYYPDPDNDKDPTLLFNTFAYALSNACGRYAPRFRFVEVFVHEDGGDLSLADRRGVYALIEKVSRGNDRLDFQKLAPDGTSGTWLLNINRMDPVPETGWPAANGATQPQFFHTRGPNGLAQSVPNGPVGGDDLPQQSNGYLNFDNPSGYEISAAQRASIEGWFQQFEAVLYNNAQWRNPVSGYRAWLDDRDFAEFFVFHTLTHNGDGLLISMFPWRGDDGRLRMGPVWDFNWASYYISGTTTGDLLWRSNQLWYARLFTDSDFNQLFIDRWTAFRRGPMSNASMDALIDAQAAEITEAKAVQQGIPTAANWQSRLTQMKTWLRTRANWIDSQFVPAPQLSHPGGNVSANFSLGMTTNIGAVFYTTDDSDPRAPGGNIAAGAQSTLPAVLNGVARVMARVRNGTAWSGLVSATFVAGAEPASTANLAITEIHYHPAFAPGLLNSDDLEFVELQNISPLPLSLFGVRFVREGAGIEFDFSTGSILTLAAGERVVVVKNRAAFEAHYGANIPVAGEYAGNLSNAGDTLTLRDSVGAILSSFTYRDAPPWPTGADGSGYSLVFPNPSADFTNAQNWRTSTTVGGNPGATDVIPLSGSLLEYVCGTGVPELTFDRAQHILSFRRRAGTDGVSVTPEQSDDLVRWETGPALFSFAGETRDVSGGLRQHWLVRASDNSGQLFFRVRIDPR